jgi:phospholipid/cholesterol/gamma-HCH transport system permease protein
VNTDSLVTLTSRDEGLVLTATGSWTANNAGDLERSLDALALPGDRGLVIEAGGVREFDTYGAWLLERLARSRPDTRILGLPDDYQDLFAKVRATNRQGEPAAAAVNPAVQAVARLGRSMAELSTGFAALLAMIGALTESLLRAILRPLSFRLTSLVQQLDRTAWQAVPIILLITFLIGCIISQQAIFHFRKFGAEDYVVDLVGILVLREIGVLIVAIMVAGRSGSSYTAELGSMKMREEIDALRTMGRDPIDVLVLPRVLALVIALPILALLREAVSLSDFQVGMTKAPFMAFMIGAVAASEGFKVAGSTESLGLRTTSSVVQSIFLVIVLDGVFAIFFAALGL